MAQLNSPLLSDLQNTSFQEKINISLNTADLDWLGNDCKNDKRTFEKYNVNANTNRVLLWLASKDNEYPRESIKGGVLWSLINQKNNDANLHQWEEIIKERFNEDFAQDLELFLLKLSMDTINKKLIINMIVRDRIKNKTFPVSTGVNV